MRLGSALFLLMSIGLIQGCSSGGSGGKVDLDPAKKHILNAARYYNAYSNKHGKAPKDVKQIKSWVKGLKADERKTMGLTDVSDDVFVSPRDHKEYAVHADTRKQKMGPNPLTLYEQDGVGGKRLAANQMGNVREIDEQQLQNYLNQK